MSNISVMARGSALDLISNIKNGNIVLEMEDGLTAAAQAAMETGKKTKVIIEISLDHDQKVDAMRVSAKVKTKLPEKAEQSSLFFVTPEGKLSRYDTRQPRMFHNEDEV